MAPSHFEFGCARAWRAGVLALAALALLAAAAWALTLVGRGEAGLAWLALPAALLALWAASAGRLAGGTLRDEGGRWWLDAAPGSLAVAFDFGAWMLLRFRPDGARRSRWLAPSHADMREAWPAFRRAVYSPRTAPAGLSAQAHADPPA